MYAGREKSLRERKIINSACVFPSACGIGLGRASRYPGGEQVDAKIDIEVEVFLALSACSCTH